MQQVSRRGKRPGQIARHITSWASMRWGAHQGVTKNRRGKGCKCLLEPPITPEHAIPESRSCKAAPLSMNQRLRNPLTHCLRAVQ